MDSFSKNGLVGIGTYWQDLGWLAAANIISDASTLSNSLGKLARIEAATAQIWSAVKYSTLSNKNITVFTDSQYALKQLVQDSGRFLTRSIAWMSHEINSLNTNTNMRF